MNYILDNNKEDNNKENDNTMIVKKVIKKNIMSIKTPLNNLESKYDEYPYDNFKNKLGKYTFGLDKIIPWEDGEFIFSGGLLFDIITNRFSQDLMDIDLFFYGSIENKIKTINKICDNLDKNQYSYLIGNNRAVIYIFIQGIPRIIQLIMTNKSNPESIINDFDMTHVMSYTDGNKIFCSPKTLKYLETKSKLTIENKYFNKNRIIKYIERGIIDENIIQQKYNWILNEYDSNKYLNTKKQNKFYKLTYNLTRYVDGEQINFRKIDKSKINLSIFECAVNYNKLDNHDFMEDVDMFGAFAQYMRNQKKENIISDVENFNSNESIKYYSISNYDLIPGRKFGFSYLFYLKAEKSLYIPCNFIKKDEIIQDEMNNKILKIYFEIKDKNIIKHLKSRINKYLILDSLKYNYLGSKLIESKYKLDSDKIYTPFEKNYYDNHIINENEDEEKDKKNESLVICAKLYNADINEFYNVNDFGILTSLEEYEQINCLFDLSIFVFVSNIQPDKIGYVDINLKPMFIFKKK